MYHLRRYRTRWLPFVALWWVGVACAWLAVWTAVWSWEAYGPATIRAARTTSRIFGWTR